MYYITHIHNMQISQNCQFASSSYIDKIVSKFSWSTQHATTKLSKSEMLFGILCRCGCYSLSHIVRRIQPRNQIVEIPFIVILHLMVFNTSCQKKLNMLLAYSLFVPGQSNQLRFLPCLRILQSLLQLQFTIHSFLSRARARVYLPPLHSSAFAAFPSAAVHNYVV